MARAIWNGQVVADVATMVDPLKDVVALNGVPLPKLGNLKVWIDPQIGKLRFGHLDHP